MSGTKGMLHYKVETNQEAVRLVLEEHLTYAEVAIQLGIRKLARIEAWVRMYREEGEASFHKPIRRPIKAQAEQRELERLRMENTLLKNSIPNCGACGTQCAISGHLPLQRRIRSESHVRILCYCASRLLRVRNVSMKDTVGEFIVGG